MNLHDVEDPPPRGTAFGRSRSPHVVRKPPPIRRVCSRIPCPRPHADNRTDKSEPGGCGGGGDDDDEGDVDEDDMVEDDDYEDEDEGDDEMNQLMENTIKKINVDQDYINCRCQIQAWQEYNSCLREHMRDRLVVLDHQYKIYNGIIRRSSLAGVLPGLLFLIYFQC